MASKLHSYLKGHDLKRGHTKTAIERDYIGGIQRKLDPEQDAEEDMASPTGDDDEEEDEIKQKMKSKKKR